jgi:hypothetical protein
VNLQNRECVKLIKKNYWPSKPVISKFLILKAKIVVIPLRHHLIVAIPEGGRNTEHHKEYYKATVTISAKVIRESFYKKPKLRFSSVRFLLNACSFSHAAAKLSPQPNVHSLSLSK